MTLLQRRTAETPRAQRILQTNHAWMHGEACGYATCDGIRRCERCASVVTCPFCSGLIISNVIDRMHSCQDARWSFWNVPGALEQCASLHRLGARASRSRATLRLITGARVGRARSCTAWVRERRACVSRCASSHKQQGRGMLRPCCDLSCCWLWGAGHLL